MDIKIKIISIIMNSLVKLTSKLLRPNFYVLQGGKHVDIIWLIKIHYSNISLFHGKSWTTTPNLIHAKICSNNEYKSFNLLFQYRHPWMTRSWQNFSILECPQVTPVRQAPALGLDQDSFQFLGPQVPLSFRQWWQFLFRNPISETEAWQICRWWFSCGKNSFH